MRTRLWVCALHLGLGGCESWSTTNPSRETAQLVAGCEEAVHHLQRCCPGYSSYISCAYLQSAVNSNARLDLSPGQSRCLIAKSCEVIARAVVEGRSLCGLDFASRSCR
jgi:hypothetical protein